MDLSKLSDSDLLALQSGDLSKLSDEGLSHLHQSTMADSGGPVPTRGKARFETPKEKGLADKAAQFISGGKFGTMQDLIYGGEKPEDTILGRTGQIVRQSGLEGLQGMPATGQLESAVTAIGSNIPTATSVASKVAEKAPGLVKAGQTVGQKLGNALNYVEGMPARYLSYQSKVPVENIRAAYQVGRGQEPKVVEKFKDVLENANPEFIGQYNYARKFGLPPEEAAKVTRMGYEDESAFWNRLDAYLKAGNRPFPILSRADDFSKLSEADKIRYAHDLGMSFGSIKPTTKGGTIASGAEGGLAALEASNFFPAISKLIGGAKFAPLLAVHAASKSPYLAGRAAYGTGAAAAKIAPLMNAEVPTSQTAALLARMLSNQGEQ